MKKYIFAIATLLTLSGCGSDGGSSDKDNSSSTTSSGGSSTTSTSTSSTSGSSETESPVTPENGKDGFPEFCFDEDKKLGTIQADGSCLIQK